MEIFNHLEARVFTGDDKLCTYQRELGKHAHGGTEYPMQTIEACQAECSKQDDCIAIDFE